MLAIKDAPVSWAIEQILGEGALAFGQHYFGTAGAIVVTIAVTIALDAYFGEGRGRTRYAEPSEPLTKAVVWFIFLAAVIVVGLIGGALLWATAVWAFPELAMVDQAGGVLCAMMAVLGLYLLVRKELWR